MRIAISLVFLWASVALTQAIAATHPVEFWRSIAKNGYAVPQGESGDALSSELSTLLGSPDPELRDDLAYSIFARWIAHPNILSTEQLVRRTDEWRANLKSGIGDAGTNSVLTRSFSALCLASMAKREAKAPFLGASRFHQLVADAMVYLNAEKDLRGYDARLGWIHATAHAADLLEALAASSQMNKEEEGQILTGAATRVATAPEVYTQGEQDRLAAAVCAVVRRPNFDVAIFDQWLDRIQNEDRNVWKTSLTPQALAVYQNHTYMLQALSVHLALQSEAPAIAGFKTKVLAILRAR